MSYNGSGTFLINTAGQPVVAGTVISDSVFNAFTADVAAGLTNCITKDGQQTITADIPWGGRKITGLGFGSANADSVRLDQARSISICEGRLTLASGSPITSSDILAAETLYFTPYKGNCVAVYDGTRWVTRTFTELSIDVPDVTGVHDVFIYDNAGSLALEVLAWASNTVRATFLSFQDGVYVKELVPTRRYLGTFYSTTAGNGQIEDSFANRYLWNYYNRVVRVCRVRETTNTWNYTTATIRQANGSTANQLNMVIGIQEDPVSATLRAAAFNSGGAAQFVVGMAVDSTTAFASATYIMAPPTSLSAANVVALFAAEMEVYTGVGKHFISWNEWSQAVGTTTWIGDNNDQPVAGSASGMQGRIFG